MLDVAEVRHDSAIIEAIMHDIDHLCDSHLVLMRMSMQFLADQNLSEAGVGLGNILKGRSGVGSVLLGYLCLTWCLGAAPVWLNFWSEQF